MRKLTPIIVIVLLLFPLSLVAQTNENPSPTDTLKAYYDAAKKKDIDTMKKYLSRGSIEMMEKFAKAQGKSLDQMFQEGANRDAQMPTPEFSNEKVDGDNATVDIKAPNQPTVTMQMVKEDGMWKLAIDKMMKNAGITAPSSSSSRNASASKFVGTWHPVKDDGSEDSPFRITFKDDGTYMITSKNNEGTTIKGTYTVSGETATLSDPEGKGDDGIATIGSDGRLRILGTKSKGVTYFIKE